MSCSVPDPAELRILDALIDSAMCADCSVSVFDGEEWVLRQSRDPAAILAAVGSADMDVLSFRKRDEFIGSVKLVYGNGVDVISDCSWPAGTSYEGSWLEAIVESALKVALPHG